MKAKINCIIAMVVVLRGSCIDRILLVNDKQKGPNMAAKIHYRLDRGLLPGNAIWACKTVGRLRISTTMQSDKNVTDDPEKVTCPKCKKTLVQIH